MGVFEKMNLKEIFQEIGDIIECIFSPLICLIKGHKYRKATIISLNGETHICRRCCCWNKTKKFIGELK